MRTRLFALGLGLTAVAGVLAFPAAADTKAGVDAWNRGDYSAAVAQWRPAAVAGDADAQFNLGQAYKLGRGVPVDLAMAAGWYQKSAAQGNQQGEDAYGLTLFQLNRHGEAVPWLEKAVVWGEPRAQLVLGTMLYNGDSVSRDWPRAYALLLRASAQGLPQAAQVIAQMDKYIPTEDRQRGMSLARDMEARQRTPQLPPELAQANPGRPMATTPVAPSRYDPAAPPAPPAPTPRPRPTPRAAETAPPAPAAVGGKWRVQLGAFGSEANGRSLWEQLKRRVSALGRLQPYLVRAGSVTRLQAGPIASSAQAAKVCAAVKAAGNACLPVAP